jgi:hypothetical protein
VRLAVGDVHGITGRDALAPAPDLDLTPAR